LAAGAGHGHHSDAALFLGKPKATIQHGMLPLLLPPFLKGALLRLLLLSPSTSAPKNVEGAKRKERALNGIQYFLADWVPDDAPWQLFNLFITLLVGYLGYRLGQRNERVKERAESDQVRVQFVAWLRALKAESQQRIMEMHGYRLNWPAFTQSIPELISACELVRAEIPSDRIAEFDTLVQYLSTRGPRDFDSSKESYNKIYESIDRLVAIVRP
jgi:hypothetical protein